MDLDACHAGWLLKRCGPLRRWASVYFALFNDADGPKLLYKTSLDTSWQGCVHIQGCGGLPLGEGHPTAACFCACASALLLW